MRAESMYTPGPLYVEPDGRAAFRIKSEEYGTIAYIPEQIEGLGYDEMTEANAYLYAAAPELLEACKVALEVMANVEWVAPKALTVKQTMRAAIAKAEPPKQ